MNASKRNQIIGIILLVLTSFIWGTAFVAQSDAMDHIGPMTMNGLRTLLAAVVLFPLIFVSDKIKGKKPSLLGTEDKTQKKKVLLYGLLCGIAITFASTIQQWGIKYTSVGKSGFLTTLYVVFAPLIGLLLGKKINWNGWVAVVLAMAGMFLICIEKNEPLNIGDLLVVISAIFFAIHILFVDKFIHETDGIRLSCMQFIVCGVTCLVGALIFEEIEIKAIINASFSIIYTGVFSAALGYTLQIVAQRWVAPHIAPLIMCLESVFALFAGILLRHENLHTQVYWGCVLVFVAIILAQIQFKSKKGKKQENLN